MCPRAPQRRGGGGKVGGAMGTGEAVGGRSDQGVRVGGALLRAHGSPSIRGKRKGCGGGCVLEGGEQSWGINLGTIGLLSYLFASLEATFPAEDFSAGGRVNPQEPRLAGRLCRNSQPKKGGRRK